MEGLGERPRRVEAWLVGDKIPGELAHFVCRVLKPTQRAATLASLCNFVEPSTTVPAGRGGFQRLESGPPEAPSHV